jgi:type I restriction enzyme M protein
VSNRPRSRPKCSFIERCLDLLKPGGRLGIVLAGRNLQQPLAGLRARIHRRPRLPPRRGQSAAGDLQFSSGASVKCSLLFLQKFTEQEQASFDETKQTALREIREKYAPEMVAETTRLETLIEAAKKKRDTDARKAAQKELTDYTKRMEERIKTESRALLKERFSYPVFLYEAEKVGITATGEEGPNELYPCGNFPADLEKSCLELYREFRENPEAFMLTVEGA